LWTKANTAFQTTPPDVGGAATIVAGLPILLDKILVLDGQPIKATEPDKVIAIDSTDGMGVNALADAVKWANSTPPKAIAGQCGAKGTGLCQVDKQTLGTMIDSYVTNFDREGKVDPAFASQWRAEQQRRWCKALKHFPQVPELPIGKNDCP
jgi:hypothetical protein